MTTEVVYVQAHSRKLKAMTLLADTNNDLRCCGCHSPSGGPGVQFEENDYYKSTKPVFHPPTEQELPAGTYFILSEVMRDQSYVTDQEELGPPFKGALKGTRVVMQTFDPRDPDKRLNFIYWAQDEPARSRFQPIENEMAIIAIAATGL